MASAQPKRVEDDGTVRRYVAVSDPRFHDFVHGLRYVDLPADVAHQARRCLLDLVGVWAGGRTTELSRIIHDHAARMFGVGQGAGARLAFDGRRVSAAGAAMAGGMTIDSIDAHDGHRLTKGHAGVAVLPAILGFADDGRPIDGEGLLAALVVGYELAVRAGIALHASVPDYHTSGAWSAVACAALGARLMGLDRERTRHAIGIAEYHGPRSQMMRCIDYPTMLKDGSGWGAMAGVSAAYLAADGFTGAPAVTVEEPALANLWSDLGSRWRIMELYFKTYPVCRWAQPAVEAALSVGRGHGLTPADIDRIEVVTFHEGTRLANRWPGSTEEAQYSLPFPVAAALAHGRVGAAEVTGVGLTDPTVLALADAITLAESADYNARFPAERWAHVAVTTKDGRRLVSAPATARGDPEAPLSDREVADKFDAYAAPVFGARRARVVAEAIMGAGGVGSAALMDLIAPAPNP
ncbi:MAG: MmgE/PrpD family protein [Alphaproteobacteria bacterium]|nr:MmgE/PrpD family protein [Alphaproteobacteria bacterium]